jgi:hypothetical protein
MINNNISRSGAPSSQILHESDSSSDFSTDSASSDIRNAEKVDSGEVAWSQFQAGVNTGNGKNLNQLLIAVEAGIFKARLAMMHESSRPSIPSTFLNENSFLNALLWGKKAINSFQAINKTKHILAISDPECRANPQNMKSIFINQLDIADSLTETSHRLGTHFASYNKVMSDQEIQEKVSTLEHKFKMLNLSEQELTSAFSEMQYLSNLYVAQKMPNKAVAIYDRLLPLLPTATPPWQTSTS